MRFAARAAGAGALDHTVGQRHAHPVHALASTAFSNRESAVARPRPRPRADWAQQQLVDGIVRHGAASLASAYPHAMPYTRCATRHELVRDLSGLARIRQARSQLRGERGAVGGPE